MPEPIKLDIKRHRGGDDWRISDRELAVQIGYVDSRDGLSTFRKLIRTHLETLNQFSVVASDATTPGEDGGRPGRIYWLTKIQAMYIASQSDMPRATQATVNIYKAFEAYEKGDFDRARLYGQVGSELLGLSPRPWDREFSPDFRDHLHRVGGWGRGEGKWNSQCAQFINKFIYGYLFGELGLKAICEANPMNDGMRAHRHHQMLKDEHMPRLRAHIEIVRAILAGVNSLQMFEDKFNNAYPRKDTQVGFIFDRNAA